MRRAKNFNCIAAKIENTIFHRYSNDFLRKVKDSSHRRCTSHKFNKRHRHNFHIGNFTWTNFRSKRQSYRIKIDNNNNNNLLSWFLLQCAIFGNDRWELKIMFCRIEIFHKITFGSKTLQIDYKLCVSSIVSIMPENGNTFSIKLMWTNLYLHLSIYLYDDTFIGNENQRTESLSVIFFFFESVAKVVTLSPYTITATAKKQQK